MTENQNLQQSHNITTCIKLMEVANTTAINSHRLYNPHLGKF